MKNWIEDGKNMVAYTDEEMDALHAENIRQGKWPPPSRTDEEIDAAIAADPDATELTDEELAQPFLPSGRGGSRPGAGRPKGTTRPPKKDRRVYVNIMLPPHIADWLKDQPTSQGKLVEQALTECFEIETPA